MLPELRLLPLLLVACNSSIAGATPALPSTRSTAQVIAPSTACHGSVCDGAWLSPSGEPELINGGVGGTGLGIEPTRPSANNALVVFGVAF